MVGVRYLKFILLSLSCLLYACDEGSGGNGGDSQPSTEPTPTRSFYMGFTPWPYDSTLDALNTTYSLIQENGDVVAHHFTQGIPWEEALNGSAYPAHLNAEIDGRLSQTLSNKKVYLAIDVLSILRDTMIGNWGENGQEARVAPWDTRSFADAEVITAYTNFALDMIARFDPDYFNYGTEANELFIRNPQGFNDFVVFAQQVYNNIKREHPDLPVMISVALKSPDSAETAAFAGQFSRIADYVDVVGASVYPYAFFSAADASSPDVLPGDWLSQIKVIAPNKPVAITETGWVAEDLNIARLGLNVNSDEAKQRSYVERLLTEAQSLNAQFIIWFTVVDFDALWNSLGRDDLSLIWRDSGLYDESLHARQALDSWQKILRRPHDTAQ